MKNEVIWSSKLQKWDVKLKVLMVYDRLLMLFRLCFFLVTLYKLSLSENEQEISIKQLQVLFYSDFDAV